MKARTASRAPWSLWALAVVVSGAALALTYLNRSVVEQPDLLLFISMPAAAVGYGTVGALITARRRNRIGWIFLVIALGFAVYPLTWAYVLRGLVSAPGSLPGTGAAGWIRTWVLTLAVAPIPLLLLLFPNGRLPSRRWRIVAWILVVFPVLNLIAVALQPGTIFESRGIRLENPLGVSAFGEGPWLAFIVPAVLWFGAAIAAVVALVQRFRRARGEERRQLKWLAYVAGIAAGFMLPGFFLAAVGFSQTFAVASLTLFVGALLIGIPAASAIAILKHGLYDVDVVIKKTVVFGVLAALVSLLYVGIVVGIGSAVTGSETNPATVLTFLAAAVLALVFQPIRRRANHLANRLVYGARATPYEVLAEFSDRMAGTYSTDDVLPRMVRTVGAGTGASRAEVWLRVQSELRLSATWPDEPHPGPDVVALDGEELPDLPERRKAFPVRHQGELLGALSVSMPPSEPLTPAGAKLIQDLAAQTGLVLRNVRLIEELRASRQRIVTAQDARAKALERNIHDGAQQQLVALMVKLRLADSLVELDPGKARAMLTDLRAETAEALDALRDLARGIYPPLLADKGLYEALSAQARKSPLPVAVEGDGLGRYPQEAEAAIYFCCLEALQNAAKYAGATKVLVRLSNGNDTIGFTVQDDGAGFDPVRTSRGAGLQNMTDRLEALGGNLDIRSHPGGGTTLIGRIPARAAPPG